MLYEQLQKGWAHTLFQTFAPSYGGKLPMSSEDTFIDADSLQNFLLRRMSEGVNLKSDFKTLDAQYREMTKDIPRVYEKWPPYLYLVYHKP